MPEEKKDCGCILVDSKPFENPFNGEMIDLKGKERKVTCKYHDYMGTHFCKKCNSAKMFVVFNGRLMLIICDNCDTKAFTVDIRPDIIKS